MLENTFFHIDGITKETEEKLWELGINTWEEFLDQHVNIDILSRSKIDKIKQELIFSQHHFENNNLSYFLSKLPQNEHWRCISCGKIGFVDIETTGLSKYTDKITTIGVYDGESSKIYVRGKNLAEGVEEIKKFDIIVTFNGKQFDIPFIEHQFRENLNVVHLDLRFMLKEFGLKGGLKAIETELGISRPEEVEDVTGLEAVKLWRKYERFGCEDSLNKLILYNIEDIVNLEKLLQYYVDRKKEQISVF